MDLLCNGVSWEIQMAKLRTTAGTRSRFAHLVIEREDLIRRSECRAGAAWFYPLAVHPSRSPLQGQNQN